jgi:hypothetical protein
VSKRLVAVAGVEMFKVAVFAGDSGVAMLAEQNQDPGPGNDEERRGSRVCVQRYFQLQFEVTAVRLKFSWIDDGADF